MSKQMTLAGFDGATSLPVSEVGSTPFNSLDVPEDRLVWTGSCPCQPFSCAGKQKGTQDERHLWPEFRRLITECHPPIIFGEQVASKLGREWLAGVRADLEALGYAVGAADLCAAGATAPHLRQRLYWVADANGGHRGDGKLQSGREYGEQPQDGGGIKRLDNTKHGRQTIKEPQSQSGCASRDSVIGMGDPESERLQEQWSQYQPSGERCSGLTGFAMQAGVPQWNGPTVAIECSDGPRRISSEPNSFPLAHGVPCRMGRLWGYGNGIVPQVAATFIISFLACDSPQINEA